MIVRAEKLYKTYRVGSFKKRNIDAVKNISLCIDSGEIFGLIGPNGSGKTTFINMVTGFLSPTSGTLEVIGGKPGELSVKKSIGYLPEKVEFQPHMTGRQILEFYGCFYNIPEKELHERVGELIEITGLSEFCDLQTKNYSKGTVQKLGVAQSLINKPSLLVLDEPYNGLDPETNRRFRKLFRQLADDGTSILMSSHLLSNIEEICTKIAVISNGVILYNGAPSDIPSEAEDTVLSISMLAENQQQELINLCKDKFSNVDVLKISKKSLEDKFLDLINK